MNRDGHKDAQFFVAAEVEHTPAFSKKTLFVVGVQDVNRILELAREHKVSHIFLGANHSFASNLAGNPYNEIITALLDRGFWVTLDYPAHEHFKVLAMLSPGIWQSRLFVPMLSVRIPKVQTSNSNLTIKIDDIDFKATNPGVWCMHFHEVTDSNRFTDWQDYGSDVVIQETDKSVPTPAKAPAKKINTETLMPVLRIPEDKIPGSNKEFRDARAEMTDDKNDQELGLDRKAKSALKGKPDVKAADVDVVDVVEAYAAGTTEDPLSAEGSKKGTKKK